MWEDRLAELQDLTAGFLDPFDRMSQLELTFNEDGTSSSPWASTCYLHPIQARKMSFLTENTVILPVPKNQS
jgi:hypothetical protein